MRYLILAAALSASPAAAQDALPEDCQQGALVGMVMTSTLRGLAGVMEDPTQPEADRDEAMRKILELTPHAQDVADWMDENCPSAVE